MNDDKTIRMTIPALCAVLGRPYNEIDLFSIDEQGQLIQTTLHEWFPILSPNDLIPTDECEKCGLKHKGLKVLEGSANLIDVINQVPKKTVCQDFKPLLRKVKTIKLTALSPSGATSRPNRSGDLSERCECGHGKEAHSLDKLDCYRCFEVDKRNPDTCSQYKPVQTVEITRA